VRNPSLRELLETFTVDAGSWLRQTAADGDGVPFEVAKREVRGAGRPPLYCYRPLTGNFIRGQRPLLAELAEYDSVAQTLDGIGGLELYLQARGEPAGRRSGAAMAELVLIEFLARVYNENTEFNFEPARFEMAYEELERSIYADRCVTEVAAPLFGLDLDPEARELALGDGLAIVRARALTGVAVELAQDPQQPLLVLRVAHERGQQPSAAFARSRLHRVLTALRLYERGAYSLGPVGYTRIGDGVWSPVAVGSPGRRNRLTLVPRDQEEDLRSFCNVVGRRLARGLGSIATDSTGAGEVAWALSRFEMGCDRYWPLEALSDHLMALRALLEPEGPASGRLTQRLAMICAAPPHRAELAERVAAAVALERAVIAGLATASPEHDALVDDVAEHLRAILRDVLCGHLDADLCAVADQLLAESVQAAAVEALI
jgi:hypothetical protein